VRALPDLFGGAPPSGPDEGRFPVWASFHRDDPSWDEVEWLPDLDGAARDAFHEALARRIDGSLPLVDRVVRCWAARVLIRGRLAAPPGRGGLVPVPVDGASATVADALPLLAPERPRKGSPEYGAWGRVLALALARLFRRLASEAVGDLLADGSAAASLGGPAARAAMEERALMAPSVVRVAREFERSVAEVYADESLADLAAEAPADVVRAIPPPPSAA